MSSIATTFVRGESVTDQELIGYLDNAFGKFSQKVDEKIDGLREELREENRQTRTALEEENRQTRAALEEEIRQTRTAQEEGDRQTRVLLEAVRSDVRLLAEGLMGQSEIFARRESETLRAIDEVKALVIPLYEDLNRRVKVLEERAEREHRDVLDVVREKYGNR